jgi:stromal membrane-associated protein
MGTHISKVKSVDLDVWTPEQMDVRLSPFFYPLTLSFTCPVAPQSIQKWGNKRANLYWEAHLKPGHVPPEQYVSLAYPSTLSSNISLTTPSRQ